MHRIAEPSLIKELMACDWTVEVDSYEKMDWISSKRVDIASYGSSVRNIFSGVFSHSAMVYFHHLKFTTLQSCGNWYSAMLNLLETNLLTFSPKHCTRVVTHLPKSYGKCYLDILSYRHQT